MPGFTTHYMFGVKNLQQMKRRIPSGTLMQSIEAHKTVFQLGLQGPDIFFYHPQSNLRSCSPGSVVHRKNTGDFLKCLVQAPGLFWKEDECRTAQAYAAGFIGHYILDTHIHPYVYCMTGHGEKLKESGYAGHIALETDMDTCMLMRYAKRLPSEFPYGKTIAMDAHARSVVAESLFCAYQTVFPELKLTKGCLTRAVRSMQIGTKLTYDPHHYKRKIMGKAERLIFGRLQISTVIPADELEYCVDPLNMQHRQWHNPWNPEETSQESVIELIKKASRQYQKAFLQLDSLYTAERYEDRYNRLLEELCQLLGHKSYHSGMDWTLGE